jgi:hypothetical protein
VVADETGYLEGDKWSDLAAFCIAPLAPSAIMTWNDVISSSSPTFGVVGDLFIFYVVSFVVEFVLGGPLYVVATRYNLVRWWTAISVGAVVGAVAISLVSLPSIVLLYNMAYGAEIGSASGFAFWLVGKMARLVPWPRR